MSTLYSLDTIIQRFGDRVVLNIPRLALQRGWIYVLQGPNGAGKTTLMRILSFMDNPSSGRISFMGEEVRPDQSARFRARVVWVPQSPVMFTGTLLYNVEYPMRLKGVPGQDRKAKALALLETVGLSSLAKAPARKLSGGESQRGSIARALAAGAEVILFDEPTANVDYRSRGEILQIIRGLCEERGISIVVTTHDAALAEELSQKRIILFDGMLVDRLPGYPAGANSQLHSRNEGSVALPQPPGYSGLGRFSQHNKQDAAMNCNATCPPRDHMHTVHVDQADPGFSLLFQSGVTINCMVGIPLMRMLHEEFGLDRQQTSCLDVFLLDGKPVDTPHETLVPQGSRLALAAGLPGIAGLAMKSNSAVRGLRPGITHIAGDENEKQHPPAPGSIELVLYSLALKRLSMHFLLKGFSLTAVKLSEVLQTGAKGQLFLDGSTITPEELLLFLASLPPQSMVFLTADVRGSI